MDLCEALVCRFKKRFGKNGFAEPLRRGASELMSSEKFKGAKVLQWTPLLDRASLRMWYEADETTDSFCPEGRHGSGTVLDNGSDCLRTLV